jgi:hypothetical protein
MHAEKLKHVMHAERFTAALLYCCFTTVYRGDEGVNVFDVVLGSDKYDGCLPRLAAPPASVFVLLY